MCCCQMNSNDKLSPTGEDPPISSIVDWSLLSYIYIQNPACQFACSSLYSWMCLEASHQIHCLSSRTEWVWGPCFKLAVSSTDTAETCKLGLVAAAMLQEANKTKLITHHIQRLPPSVPWIAWMQIAPASGKKLSCMPVVSSTSSVLSPRQCLCHRCHRHFRSCDSFQMQIWGLKDGGQAEWRPTFKDAVLSCPLWAERGRSAKCGCEVPSC